MLFRRGRVVTDLFDVLEMFSLFSSLMESVVCFGSDNELTVVVNKSIYTIVWFIKIMRHIHVVLMKISFTIIELYK